MTKEQDALDAKYSLFVKFGCIAALIVITVVDAVTTSFEASLEVQLALVGAVAGLEYREKARLIRKRKRRNNRKHTNSRR